MFSTIIARLQQRSTQVAITAMAAAVAQYGLTLHALPIVLAAGATAVANA